MERVSTSDRHTLPPPITRTADFWSQRLDDCDGYPWCLSSLKYEGHEEHEEDKEEDGEDDEDEEEEEEDVNDNEADEYPDPDGSDDDHDDDQNLMNVDTDDFFF